MTSRGGARITLHPGDVALGHRGDTLETLLGSCVTVILTDPRRTIGAMCHIVHASQSSRRDGDDTAFADAALRHMRLGLQERGIVAAMCDAYVYGGGNMFGNVPDALPIGRDNAVWTLQRLAQWGVRVLDTDVGGTVYRKVSWTVGPDAPRVTAVAM